MTQRNNPAEAKTAGKAAPKNTGQFGAGNPGKPRGAVNKTTAALKEAILRAAEDVGEDGEGKAGTVGYLRTLARSEPKAFASLLGKVLPLQVTGDGGGPFEVIGRIELVAMSAKRAG